uniref:J domain-containing protein n=1 Tax=Amphora coffeiformis TaxID=265554 RepID=A0A7S3P447_9STRA
MTFPPCRARPSYDDSMISCSQKLQKRLKKIYRRDLRGFLAEQQRSLRQRRQQRQSEMMQIIPRRLQGGVHQKQCIKKQQSIVDPYQVLQVRRDATRSEIRQAYRRLALWHHPHRFCEDKGEKQRRSQMFTMVAAAYETLMDQQCRSRCDTLLRETSQTVSSAKIPAGQIMVGKTASPLQSSPRRRRIESHDTLDYILRNSPSVIDSMEKEQENEEEDAHDGNRTSTPSLAEISLTDCSSDEDDDDVDDDTEPHKNLQLISRSEDVTFQMPDEIDSPQNQLNTRSKKPRTCKNFILDCAGGESSYDESLQLPALLNSSSSSKALGDGEKHFTETDTDRLFGGPLQLLFRARRWRPFTDPFAVYQSVFGSQLPGLSKLDDTDGKPTSWNSLEDRTSSQGELWKRGTAERQPDGSVTYTQRRLFRNKRVIRQETVWTDPVTGQKHTSVSVTSEPCEGDLALQQSRDLEQDQICHGEVCALSWTDIVQSFLECTPFDQTQL